MRRIAFVVIPLALVATALAFLARCPRGGPQEKPHAAATPPSPESAAPSAPISAQFVAATARPVEEADADPAGPVRLEGQVVDEAERPVAGARVRISTRPTREIVTQEDGSFVLDNLLPRAYAISARKDERVGGPVTVQATDKTEPVILRLHAAVTLELSVEDAERQAPIEGARVIIEDRFPGIELRTDARGRCDVLTGRSASVDLQVGADGYATQYLEIQTPTEGRVTVRVLLARGGRVTGRVVDYAGRPIVGASVRALAAAVAGDENASTTSDAQGSWSFDGLRTGSYRFLATDAEHAPATSSLVALTPGAAPSVTLTMSAGGAVHGEVVNKDGRAVGFARVRIAFGTHAAAMVRDATANERGAFSFTGLPRLSAELVAESDGATSAITSVDLAPSPTRAGIILRLDLDAEITGTVVDDQGKPVPEAQVFAMPDAVSGGPLRVRASADVTGADGAFRLRSLATGTYRLRATRDPAMARRADFWTRPGTKVAAGDRDVRLLLEELGGLRGRVVFASGTAPESFSVATGTYGAPVTMSGSDGVFVLRDLPPGRSALVITGASLVRTTTPEYEIRAGAETDVGVIVVQRGRAIRGRVLRADGSASAGARVVAGERLVSDGAELGVTDLNAPITSAKEALTDSQGVFALEGMQGRSLVVAADHLVDGRSVAMALASGDADLTIELVLAPTAALEGTVSDAGRPVPAKVVAQARSATSARFSVMSGEDGSYRFDRLARGDYVVSVVRRHGRGGNVWVSDLVTVGAVPATRHDVDLTDEELSLSVRVVTSAAQPVENAVVFLASGAIAAPTYEQLERLLGERGSGRWVQALLMKDAPDLAVTLPELNRGDYTLCVVALPVDLLSPEAGDWMRRNMERQAMTCRTQTVPAAEQPVRFVVPGG